MAAPGRLLVSLDDEHMQEAVAADVLAEEVDAALHEGPDLDGVALPEAAPADEVEVPFPLDDRGVAAVPPRKEQLLGAGGEANELHAQPAVRLPLGLGFLDLLALRGVAIVRRFRALLLVLGCPRLRVREEEEVGGMELGGGQERAEAVDGAVPREAEPVLVRVQVGARQVLVVDEVQVQVGAEPETLEEMPAQARRLFPVGHGWECQPERWKLGRDGGNRHCADGLEVAEGRRRRRRVQEQSGGGACGRRGRRRRRGGGRHLLQPSALVRGGGGGVVDDHVEGALVGAAGEGRRHLAILAKRLRTCDAESNEERGVAAAAIYGAARQLAMLPAASGSRSRSPIRLRKRARRVSAAVSSTVSFPEWLNPTRMRVAEGSVTDLKVN